MDVLGLFSNISQVVDLLIKIGVMCSIYCFDVKNAPKEVRLLLREVDRLTVVVKELEILLNGSKGATKIESPVLRQTVFDLRKLLAELVAKLDLGAKNTSTRAMWPFKKREIHDIIATIDRQKANILLNMSIEQTYVGPPPSKTMYMVPLREESLCKINPEIPKNTCSSDVKIFLTNMCNVQDQFSSMCTKNSFYQD
jgi:hypothetical protein